MTSHNQGNNNNKSHSPSKIEEKVPIRCFACGRTVSNPKEENHLGDEIICDACREEMMSSLEEAWVKHSAFLDSALN